MIKKRYIDVVLAVGIIAMYIMFRFSILDRPHDCYFLATSIGMSYFVYRSTDNLKGFVFIVLTYFWTFYSALSVLFLWYWVVLHDPKIWVYKSLIVALFFTIIFTYKKIRNGNPRTTTI